MTSHRRTPIAGLPALATLTLGVALAAPAPAYADGVGPLPQVSDQQLAASVSDIHLDASVEPLEAKAQQGGQSVVRLSTDILFDFAKADLSPAARTRIAGLAAAVPKGAALSVTGHTDGIGDAAFNRRLSQQRAEAVAAVVRGARPDLRLTVAGVGSTQPLAPETSGGKDDPVARAKNRRVELRHPG